MNSTLLLLLLGVALLPCGAEALVRGSSALALRLKLPPLVVGLTIVAYGTSAPELVVGVDAALTDHGGVVVGNAIGAGLINLTFILGIAALIRPVRSEPSALRFDAPSMVAAAASLLVVLGDGVISRLEGACLLLALAVHAVASVRWALQCRDLATEQEVVAEAGESGSTAGRQIGWVVLGLLLLAAGAHALLTGALNMARAFGMSEAAIGLTIVSFGTTLPELITVIVASRRGHTGMIVGNAVGSCIFNIFGILGAAAVATPLNAVGLQTGDLFALLAATLLLAPMLWTGRTLGRLEGAALVLLYAVYLGWAASRG